MGNVEHVQFRLSLPPVFFCTWLNPLFETCEAYAKIGTPDDDDEPKCFDGSHIYQVGGWLNFWFHLIGPWEMWTKIFNIYRQISNISHTKSQNLNVSRLILQLSLYNILKPGVKSRMKM